MAKRKYKEIEFDPITYNILRTETNRKISLCITITRHVAIYVTRPLIKSGEGENAYYHTFVWNRKTNRCDLLVRFKLVDDRWKAEVYWTMWEVRLRLWDEEI